MFQLVSHKNLYEDHHSSVPETVQYTGKIAETLHIRKTPASSSSPPNNNGAINPEDAQRNIRSVESGPKEEEDEVEVPKMDVRTTIGLLVVVTVVCQRLY